MLYVINNAKFIVIIIITIRMGKQKIISAKYYFNVDE